ncbi:MAG: tetratricopeptide repeat protein [Deltaproteobacteria bacterium]|nr:tetratricopeptide repeat protein [Deltaproteobacteria bacterium]
MPKNSRLLAGLVALSAAWAVPACTTGGNPNHPEVLRHQGACQDYITKGDFDAAESRCRLCLEYDKQNPECLNLMGVIYFNRGNFGEARDWYKRAMRSRPDFAEARNNMGVLHMVAKPPDYDEAITMFSSSIKIDPGYKDGRWNLAHAYSEKGNIAFADAQNKVLKKGINMADPGKATAYFKDTEELYAKADDHLRRLFELDPKHYRGYFQLSYIEMQRSQYASTEQFRRQNLQRALDMGLRCWELAPKDAVESKQCAGTLGAIYGAKEENDQSMTYWASCLALDPKEPECLRGFRDSAAKVALTRGGLKKYLDQIAQNPGYAQGYFNLCVGAFEQGLQDMGASACEQALALDEKLCLARYQLGKYYRGVLNQDQAIDNCKKFISCAGQQNPAEVQECKDLVAALETR